MKTEERAKRSSSGIFFLSAIFVKIEVREKGKVNSKITSPFVLRRFRSQFCRFEDLLIAQSYILCSLKGLISRLTFSKFLTWFAS